MSEDTSSNGILRPDYLSRIVIGCINGRGGVGGGMEGLRNRLRDHLAQFGVVRDNIFTRSWNHDGDDDPFGAPDLDDSKNEIFRRVARPTYLALIGHSYGGWAAAKLSRSLNLHDAIQSDFVGLIDPVFGPRNSMGSDDYPSGIVIKNWYQTNGISSGNQCAPGRAIIPCSRGEAGISCGYRNVEGAQSSEEYFLKSWDGNRERKSCEFGRRIHILVTHTTMDDNKWIWRKIYNQISEDLDRLQFVDLAELEVPGNAAIT